MTDLRLNVLFAFEKDIFDTKVTENELPKKVILADAHYNGKLVLPDKAALLYITDNIQLAGKAADIRDERVSVVFVGKPSDGEPLYDRIRDVWDISDGEELLRKRYLRLIRDIKTEFDGDFYKRSLLTLINSAPDMIWFKRIDGIHTLVNDEFCRVVQKDKNTVIGRDHFFIWDVPRPRDGSADYACAESEATAISTGETFVCDEPVRTSSGMIQLTTYKSPLYDKFGRVFGTVGIGRDVTNFSNMGIELSILLENIPFAISIFDENGKVVRMNSSFSELTGAVTEAQKQAFSFDDWKLANLREVSDVKFDNELHSAVQEYKMDVKGEERVFRVAAIEIRDNFDNLFGYFVTMQDVTYQRAYEYAMIEAANTDMLTGIYNRRYFYNYLTAIEGTPFVLMYMDIDMFKAVNDNFGHAAGDSVLVRTTELIREYFPEAVCARLGGDEFAAIDSEHDVEFLRQKSRELEEAVKKAFEKYGLGTTISIGIYETDGSGADIDRIISLSDERMYEVKRERHSAAGKSR